MRATGETIGRAVVGPGTSSRQGALRKIMSGSRSLDSISDLE